MQAHEPPDPILGAALLSRARNAIASALDLPGVPERQHRDLAEPGATFVTLHVDGELRGCIGRLTPARALDDDVRANAISAAFHDTRFEPIDRAAFSRLHIEVSVLGPASPIEAQSESEAARLLQPGVDGVILSWHGHGATFLPQVWATLPDPMLFLRALKIKAGLPGDFWAHDIALSRYRVTQYAE